jgi:hypothetical protein
MYVWMWRHLPGNVWVRMLQTLVLVLAVVALLLFVVFPWADHQSWLPFNNVTVEDGQ